MTSLIRPHSCRNCGHHQKDTNGLVCCESPPVLHVYPVPTPDGLKVWSHIAFPPVQPDWICGKWKPRIESARS